MEDRRRIDVDPPSYPVVTDKGLIKMIPVGPGLTSALVYEEGELVVSRAHAKLGWAKLEDLYMEEGRADLWQVYQEYTKARKAGMEVEPLADEYLPEEVRRRRAGQTPGKKKWTPPTLHPVEASPTRGPGRPRKGQPAAEE